ncbi:hypothetical protein CP985_10315 [Malaciobacter mytili LMG 24559]|uniref:Uncharacterized protein n=1 Tax=Malaciobacter mytili LMG 24559 TaxID=1032238 RepID=A0AAX2AEH0_9BACT|nr:hypothetical protein [Malaciobacter mytili]AXH16429.1 hypothetical protein AMYT_a0131 [Malaciobacter mytili LMG 24559]RXK15089.1 hypothetical protein CP985_10315 [Malaciobacter mytili LMG 24559]
MKKIVSKKSASKCKNIRYSLCIFLKNIQKFLHEKICFSKEELEEITHAVEQTKFNADKFTKVKEHMPKVYAVAKSLEERNKELLDDNYLLMQSIEALYHAEISNDFYTKNKVFNELGFELKKHKISKEF